MFRMTKRVCYAAVAVAVSFGVAACASGPPKTDAQQQADKVMAERVEAALNADRSLFAKHITAHADNGVVRLTAMSGRPQTSMRPCSSPGVSRASRA